MVPVFAFGVDVVDSVVKLLLKVGGVCANLSDLLLVEHGRMLCRRDAGESVERMDTIWSLLLHIFATEILLRVMVR